MDSRQPAPGDVIIAPNALSDRGFTLSIAPDGPSQLWYESYEEALRKAFAWASVSGVSVWRVNGAGTYLSVPGNASESSTVPTERRNQL
jgi:hypothetical protein